MARPIRSTTQILVVMRHHYGIFALVSQMSFGGETQGCQNAPRPALLPATLYFSPAVNCWRKVKKWTIKKNCKVENRTEKEIVFIMP